MANIIEELKALAEERKPKCPFRIALDKLVNSYEDKIAGEKAADELDSSLKMEAFPHSVIKDFLRRREIDVSSDALTEHKRGRCRCRIQLLKNSN